MAEMPRPRSMMPAPAPVDATPPPWGYPPPEGWLPPPPSTRASARIIHTADQFWQIATAYFQHQIDNPLQVVKTYKAESFTVETENPPTFEGLAMWCGVDRSSLAKMAQTREDLVGPIERCTTYIHDTLIRLGLANVYSNQLVTRYVGLAEVQNRQITVRNDAASKKADERHVARFPHPGASERDLQICVERGIEYPLYTQAQLDLYANDPTTLPAWKMPSEDFGK